MFHQSGCWQTHCLHKYRLVGNFRGFNFREWLLTREKHENKSLAKIIDYTVYILRWLLHDLTIWCYSLEVGEE